MLRTKPSLPYCGLTVVLSNPSRFDTIRLCSANGGEMFNNHCLRPEFNSMQCDFRLMEDTTPWLEETKCILLLGESAMHKYCPDTRENTLNEMRGSPLSVSGIPAIATYFPQDAVDIKDHERNCNPLSKDYQGDSDDDDSKEDDRTSDLEIKRFSKTKRSNYAFWIRADTRKCKTVIQLGGHWPTRKYPEPIYKIYPFSQEVIDILTRTKGVFLDFDMETDYVEGNPYCRNMQCFSFSVDNGRTVFCVPVLNNEYQPAYSSLHFILRALCVAVKNNIIVAHNGSGFDFVVLGHKYSIPVVQAFDTLIAQHRIYPDVEKSLGHCTSFWLWERFHKDMNPGAYRTREDMMKTLAYCGKDVYTMSLIRQEQMAYAKKVPGLEYSIDVAMKSIRPYLTTTLLGIPYSEEIRQSKIRENDRLMTQYLRMIELLIGTENMAAVRSCIKGGKAKSMPNSNKQCCEYFHNMLGYPVIQRGKQNEKTGLRQPSLAAKNMFKLRLKYENPVIDLCIAFRQTKLETSTPLGFLPWKDNDNKTVYPTTNPAEEVIRGLRTDSTQSPIPTTY